MLQPRLCCLLLYAAAQLHSCTAALPGVPSPSPQGSTISPLTTMWAPLRSAGEHTAAEHHTLQRRAASLPALALQVRKDFAVFLETYLADCIYFDTANVNVVGCHLRPLYLRQARLWHEPPTLPAHCCPSNMAWQISLTAERHARSLKVSGSCCTSSVVCSACEIGRSLAAEQRGLIMDVSHLLRCIVQCLRNCQWQGVAHSLQLLTQLTLCHPCRRAPGLPRPPKFPSPCWHGTACTSQSCTRVSA